MHMAKGRSMFLIMRNAVAELLIMIRSLYLLNPDDYGNWCTESLLDDPKFKGQAFGDLIKLYKGQ